MRKIVAGFLTSQRIASLESSVRELARELVDDMAEKGDCEIVADLASPVPLRVISVLLDLDPDRAPDYLRWANASLIDESECPDEAAKRKRRHDLAEMESFLQSHLQECRNGREQGPFSKEVVAQLNDHEALDVLKLLMVAGYVTTAGLMGNVVMALLEHPDVMQTLRHDPSRIPDAIEETLRINSPALSVSRRPREDVTLGGQRLPANAVMFLLLGSANHQEERFPDPERFSLDRETKSHLSFGKGAHYCLGANLSRMEVRVMLETLLERIETIEAAEPLDEIEWEANIHLRCPTRLKVRVKAFA